MRVRMPFVYFASYVPFKRKRERGELFLDHVEADVPEVDTSDVEVVAQWTYRSNLMEAKGDPTTRCVRWQGRLFVPASNSHLPDLPASRLPCVDGTRKNADLLQQVYEATPFSAEWNEVRRAILNISTLSPDPSGKGKVLETRIEQERKSAQELADGLLTIDGMVWKNVPNIFYRLDHYPGEDECHLTIGTGANAIDRRPFSDPVAANILPLRVKRFDLMKPGDMEPHLVGLKIDQWYGHLEVFSPEAVAFNGRSDFLARLMQCAVHRDLERVGGFDGDRIEQWVSFRDAVAAHVADPLADIPEETVARLVEYISEETLFHELGRVPDLIEVIERYTMTGLDHTSKRTLGL